MSCLKPKKVAHSGFHIKLDSMGSISSDELPKPKRLKTLAFNSKRCDGNNLLHQFVLDNSEPNVSGTESYIRAILRSMSDSTAVNALNNEGYSALHLAVLKNNILMVKQLLSCLRDIDVNTISKARRHFCGSRDTALHLVLKMGYFSFIQRSQSVKADVTVRTSDSYTVLSERNVVDILKLLVAEGADVNLIGYSGAPLDFAAALGSLEAVKYLTSCGADLKSCRISPLIHAIQSLNFNMEVVKFLVENGADLRGAIFAAAEYGKLEALEYLVSCGADWSARDGWGKSTLHRAAESGDLATVEFLVGLGADVNATDFFVETPLHRAALFWNFEVAQFLIGKGANVNALDGNGCSPLYGSVREDCLEICLLLESHGANLNAVYPGGLTILHVAAINGYVSIVEWLIERGLDVNVVDEDGETALHRAARWGHLEVIRLLLDAGAEVCVRDKNGKTPLHVAIECEKDSCIDALQNCTP